ncbi:MAG: hypothetical protein RLY43_1961 [Bacteroidota bacterium]|jgi:hypothetical protein
MGHDVKKNKKRWKKIAVVLKNLYLCSELIINLYNLVR